MQPLASPIVWLAALGSACVPPGMPSDTPPSVPEAVRCNGHAALCDRRLDEVTLAMTHNAMSSAEEGWLGPNQTWAIPRQLEDGIRGFMLDTYEVDGEVVLCHGVCDLGQSDLVDVLDGFRSFLEAHPHEVLWFVLQDGASPEATVRAFDDAGLTPFAATLDPEQPLPTLRALVDAGTPLIVSTESDRRATAPAWYHHAYTLAWDNPYAAKTPEDFSCDRLRGDQDNPLFLLNHFLTAPIALPSLAEQANPADVLIDHVQRCEDAHGTRVNALAVDFYELGDVLSVVDRLNGVTAPEGT